MNLCDPCETAGTCIKRGECIFENPRARARFADEPGVSWWHVIVMIEKHSYTHAAIAAAIGSYRGTVEDWKNGGAEPRHEMGERLCALWRVVTGRPHEEIPRKLEKSLSASEFRDLGTPRQRKTGIPAD
jgi:hypothetical protein